MFNGKALYNPQGRSGEYSQWAVNFYNGCTGGCEYCYNRRFPLLSAPKPRLKSVFKDEKDAFDTATKEILRNKADIIRDGGIFLSFVSDPCLPETIGLTMSVLAWAGLMQYSEAMAAESTDTRPIPVAILTKRADWVLDGTSPGGIRFSAFEELCAGAARNYAFGFTLTGHDDLEPGCSSNADRLRAMKVLHDRGYRTWASIEPVIDFRSSLEMIRACAPFCDHFKVGLRTDRKFECKTNEFVSFVNGIRETVNRTGSTVYFKRSLRDLVGGGYIIGKNFVEEGFNMFGENRPDYTKIFND